MTSASVLVTTNVYEKESISLRDSETKFLLFREVKENAKITFEYEKPLSTSKDYGGVFVIFYGYETESKVDDPIPLFTFGMYTQD